MSFLNPFFLFALLTVAVPLIIYLLNIRKPKRIRFSTLTFFETLQTAALKRIRIKRWLLLAVRCLAVIALVIAASRPFLPSGLGWASESEPKAVGILIDNSPTMAQVDREGPAFEQAVNMAREWLTLADSDDRILIDVTNGTALNTPFLSPRGAINRLSEIEIANSGNYLSERLFAMSNRLREAQEPNSMMVFITDGQATQFSGLMESDVEDLFTHHIQVMQVGVAGVANTGFQRVEIQTDESEETRRIQVQTVLENTGSQSAENRFLSLIVDDELIAQQPFEIDPGETEEFLFDLPNTDSSSIPVELLIEGDELSFDNRFYASVQLPELRNILVLKETVSGRTFNSYLQPMLEVAGRESDRFEIDIKGLEELRISELFDYEVVVLDGIRNIPDYLSQTLLDHVQTGAGLLFLPAAEGNLNSYNRLLNFGEAGRYTNVSGSYGSFETIDRMATPTEGHPVLDTIFDKPEDEEIRLNVPEIFYYYEIESVEGGSVLPILHTRTGLPLLNEVRVGNGRIIYSAIGSDPGWSNFPVKPFFAPFFYRIIHYLAQSEGAVLNDHTLGETFRTLIQQSPENIRLKKENETILPQTRRTFQGTEVIYDAVEWTPGWLTLETDDRSVLFSVNQDAMESRLESLQSREIEELFKRFFSSVEHVWAGSDVTGNIAQLETASFGREIWYWFVIIAIILLLLESLISRYYKAETIQ